MLQLKLKSLHVKNSYKQGKKCKAADLGVNSCFIYLKNYYYPEYIMS